MDNNRNTPENYTKANPWAVAGVVAAGAAVVLTVGIKVGMLHESIFHQNETPSTDQDHPVADVRDPNPDMITPGTAPETETAKANPGGITNGTLDSYDEIEGPNSTLPAGEHDDIPGYSPNETP